MRRKARSVKRKSNSPNINEANLPTKAAAYINTPVKTSSILNKPSTSETPRRRQTLSLDKDNRLKIVAPSVKASAYAPASNKATSSADNTVQSKKPAPPKKVILAKKAIVAKTTSATKKEKVVKAERMRRTNLNAKLPIRAGKNKVCTKLGRISVCNN